MRKLTYSLSLVLFCAFTGIAQTIIYDNGPVVTHPGAGTGGADISARNAGMTVNGYGHNYGIPPALPVWVADDFIIPAGETWTIDSIVFYAYQSNSGLTPTITGVYASIWNGSPDVPGNSIVYGDTTAAMLLDTKFSNIYRTGQTTMTAVDRPLMRNALEASPKAVLTAGTYWMVWATTGSIASGPWVPPISYADPAKKATGDALQRNAGTWVFVTDTGGVDPLTHSQGLPFILVGSKTVGIVENVKDVSITIFPNPVSTTSTIAITHNNHAAVPSKGYTFVVYDVLGKEVKRAEAIKTSYPFSREGLSNGAYMYELRDGNKALTRGKLIVD